MTGTVSLSMEIELGWGVHDIDSHAHLSADGAAERLYLRRLLAHCDDLDLPISFNVVGHLCQSRCGGDHDGPHRNGWFESDPGTDAAANELFYAPEMVHTVLERPVDHELCTHTYSHVLCGDSAPETVAWELDRVQSQMRAITGSETVSLVPPRHSRPPADVLRDAGIEVMRMSVDTSDRNPVARCVELLLGPHPQFEPAVVDGVLETYCTTYPSLTSSALPAGQRPPPRVFRPLPVRARQRLQRRYLRRAVDAAVESDGYCHLWCHLYDLANEWQWPVVREFLAELAARHRRGELDVVTMAGLNDRLGRETGEVRARATVN